MVILVTQNISPALEITIVYSKLLLYDNEQRLHEPHKQNICSELEITKYSKLFLYDNERQL